MVFPRLSLGRAFRSFFSTGPSPEPPLAYQTLRPNNAAVSRTSRPIIFMHGLFGSKQNNRSMSKVLANELKTTVYAIDLRNHGDSPHSRQHDYNAMAYDVEYFMESLRLENPVLIGHSMGAKTAMAVALRCPDNVSAVISVDNAPVSAPLSPDFAKYIRGMKQIDAANVTKQSEADEILQQYEESLPIRQFLLTNLVRSKEDGTLKFRLPLQFLDSNLDNMADFPYRSPVVSFFKGPALFVKGTRSGYISDESIPMIKKFFPSSKLVSVEAGHWLISENPEAFKNEVVDFLKSCS